MNSETKKTKKPKRKRVVIARRLQWRKGGARDA